MTHLSPVPPAQVSRIAQGAVGDGGAGVTDPCRGCGSLVLPLPGIISSTRLPCAAFSEMGVLPSKGPPPQGRQAGYFRRGARAPLCIAKQIACLPPSSTAFRPSTKGVKGRPP